MSKNKKQGFLPVLLGGFAVILAIAAIVLRFALQTGILFHNRRNRLRLQTADLHPKSLAYRSKAPARRTIRRRP